MDMFLQEIEASVVTYDVKGFSVLAAQLGPVELGAELGRFYEHIAEHVGAAGGRIVKFVGDAVLAVFLGHSGYREAALESVAAALKARDAWLKESAQRGRPLLDYTIGAASGEVLAGDVGIPALRAYDVLGQPVNFAFRLSTLAASRGVTHLITASAFEGSKTTYRGIEVDGVEFAGKPVRLFRLEV